MKLTFATKLAYWFGQLAEGLTNSAFSILLLFYFNQVMGVSGTLCGLALFIATSVDAVTDPMMGTISDTWRSRLGRRHPFMYLSAVPLAVCLYALFNPAVSGEFHLFLWLALFAVLTRVSMTLFHVPHMALGAEMSTDFDERTSIVAFRMVFGVTGWLVVAGLGFGHFFAATPAFPNGQLNPHAYPKFILILSIGIFIAVMVTSLGTQSLVARLPQPRNRGATKMTHIFSDLKQALMNRSFRWLVLSFLTASIAIGIHGALNLYVNTFFWRLSPRQIPVVLVSAMLSTMTGYMLSPAMGRYIDKKTLLIGGVGIWAVATLAPFVLFYFGFFPHVGGKAALIVLMSFAVIGGMGIAQLVVTISSMMADIADEHELDSGRRTEGVFFGAFSFCNKAAGGVGSAIGGMVLDLIHWPRGSHIRVAADIDHATLIHLAIVAGPAIAISFVPFYLIIRHYDLDRHRHAEIRRKLELAAAQA